jgi:hypothetical protein
VTIEIEGIGMVKHRIHLNIRINIQMHCLCVTIEIQGIGMVKHRIHLNIPIHTRMHFFMLCEIPMEVLGNAFGGLV